ncbi:hypothetical protein FJZ36_02550 [Candidatus Poribacteria bacterium]|nr:hypothetical protein [Candidatus Poribacteria bacterium]
MVPSSHPSLPVSAEEIPPEEASQLLDRMADAIVRRGMSAPALFALEMCKPLNFVGSQVMIALSPIVTAFLDRESYRKVALLLERDEHLEGLLQRIERLEAVAHAAKARNEPKRRDRLHARLIRFFRRS